MELKMCKHSFRFVKLHTSNYMYSGKQKMIELALFTIRRLRLCPNEKVIYKTKLNEYIYFVGLDNPYRLKNWFYSNCYTLTSSNVTFCRCKLLLCLQRCMPQGKTLEPYLLVKCCNKYIAPIYVDCNTNRVKVKQSLLF